jgi:hypothetical protein
MPQIPTRLLALTLLSLLILSPTLATAQPQGKAIVSAAERPETGPNLLFRLLRVLSAAWATGSILEPDGAGANSGPGTDPNAGTGDTGPGLEPNG